MERALSNVGFAVGTGRCGTKFLAELFAQDPLVASHHERHAFNDTFHRYCRWYGLDVDEAGFLETKRRAIEQDLCDHMFSFEASAFLSLSLDTLVRNLNARVVMMVRRPDRVVASYLNKGWFSADPALDDPHRPPSMQGVAQPHHFLGRTMPKGAEFTRWRELTRVGKIAWFWNILNRSLVEQSEQLADCAMFQRLEDMDYSAYRSLAAFLGAPQGVSETVFTQTRTRRPNASYGARTIADWTIRERDEFEAEVREMAEHFGYERRIAVLERETPVTKPSLKHALQPLRRRGRALMQWARPT